MIIRKASLIINRIQKRPKTTENLRNLISLKSKNIWKDNKQIDPKFLDKKAILATHRAIIMKESITLKNILAIILMKNS